MALQEAIAADDINQLYRLIEGDIYLLDQGSEGPFPNTPLHDAADQGKTKVAMEIATLKPSYAEKLNHGGYSPMHLALQNKHYHLVRALMTLDPELIRVRGRGGITPLHFVAGKIGDDEQENKELLDLLAEFLFACESSIKDLTNQCETAVHIAVRIGNTEAFKVLFGWLKRVHLMRILDCKDQYGDTVLHIATSEKQPEIIKLLIGYMTVNVKNFQGNTALEIFQANPSGDPDVVERFHQIGHQERRFTTIISLSTFYSTELTLLEKYRNWIGRRDNSSREAVLIVSTLVAAATYQAALAPPKGYWQDSSPDPQANSTIVTANSSSIALGKPHQAGDLILSGDELSCYTIMNSMAFFASIAVIGACALTLKDRRLASAAVLPIVFLCFSYLVTFTLQIPKTNKAAVSYLATAFLLFWLGWLSLFIYATRKLKIVLRRIDATWRQVKD
ncbi:ankyrin repeat-containing protein BDA1-like [Eucalyptus grandis]|uniref:ankyrin repeat-containing protein BDA1-like n=1 Tax=Eucalyptus grandis TaxID=71139 RepID=UPI00192EED88|nr:ankyrin repeat-containing protein BDA1-like [Eucalyptus grandis]